MKKRKYTGQRKKQQVRQQDTNPTIWRPHLRPARGRPQGIAPWDPHH